MNKNYNSSQQNLMLGLIYLAFGLILAFFNTSIITTAARVIGVILLAYGAYELYDYFGRHDRMRGSVPLVYGIACLVLGFILTFVPGTLISLLPFGVGLVMIINGVLQLSQAFAFRRAGMGSWAFSAVVSGIMIVAGIVICFNPLATIGMMLKLSGAFLAVEGAFMIFEGFQAKGL